MLKLYKVTRQEIYPVLANSPEEARSLAPGVNIVHTEQVHSYLTLPADWDRNTVVRYPRESAWTCPLLGDLFPELREEV